MLGRSSELVVRGRGLVADTAWWAQDVFVWEIWHDSCLCIHAWHGGTGGLRRVSGGSQEGGGLGSLQKTREFQTQLLHYFSNSDNKSNHLHDLRSQIRDLLPNLVFGTTRCHESINVSWTTFRQSYNDLQSQKFPLFWMARKTEKAWTNFFLQYAIIYKSIGCAGTTGGSSYKFPTRFHRSPQKCIGECCSECCSVCCSVCYSVCYSVPDKRVLYCEL